MPGRELHFVEEAQLAGYLLEARFIQQHISLLPLTVSSLEAQHTTFRETRSKTFSRSIKAKSSDTFPFMQPYLKGVIQQISFAYLQGIKSNCVASIFTHLPIFSPKLIRVFMLCFKSSIALLKLSFPLCNGVKEH